MNIDVVNIDTLRGADYNPRIDLKPGMPEYDKLRKSIEHFGYVEPIIVNDRTGRIVGGHQRLAVLKDLGYTEVEVVRIDLDEDNEKALNIALNKISGDWDTEKLEDLLRDIDLNTSIDLEFTGFDTDELNSLFDDWPSKESISEEEDQDKKEEELDNFEDDKIPQRVNKGDLWRLGNHLLFCGDCTEEASYQALLGESRAVLVFTDPPYGMRKASEGVTNDNLNFDDLLKFNKAWVPLTFKYSKDNGSWYCWGMDEPLMDLYSNILKPMIRSGQITFKQIITWDKGSTLGQHSSENRMYAVADEKCLFVMIGEQEYKNNTGDYFEGFEPVRLYLKGEADRVGLTPQKLKEVCGVGNYAHWFTKSQFTFIPEKHYNKLRSYYNGEAFNMTYAEFIEQYGKTRDQYDELKKQYYKTRAYFDNAHDNFNSVWHFNRLVANSKERLTTGGHATPKPIALCSRAIKSSSREGDIVLDVFGGSGSTLIACEQLNRVCCMMELEPHWCDVIINRWEQLTGQKATKLER